MKTTTPDEQCQPALSNLSHPSEALEVAKYRRALIVVTYLTS